SRSREETPWSERLGRFPAFNVRRSARARRRGIERSNREWYSEAVRATRSSPKARGHRNVTEDIHEETHGSSGSARLHDARDATPVPRRHRGGRGARPPLARAGPGQALRGADAHAVHLRGGLREWAAQAPGPRVRAEDGGARRARPGLVGHAAE